MVIQEERTDPGFQYVSNKWVNGVQIMEMTIAILFLALLFVIYAASSSKPSYAECKNACINQMLASVGGGLDFTTGDLVVECLSDQEDYRHSKLLVFGVALRGQTCMKIGALSPDKKTVYVGNQDELCDVISFSRTGLVK